MKISPKQFVELLEDKVIGQDEAKRILAVALRNRWRRFQLDSNIQKHITPKNVMMIGPTGVGKTAIIRATAELIDAPMVKVEATRYTQVGYHGEDVKNMISDLVNVAIRKLDQKQKDFQHGKTAFNFNFDSVKAKIFLNEIKTILKSVTKRKVRIFKDIYGTEQIDKYQSRVMMVDKRVGDINNYNHLAILMLNDLITPDELSMAKGYDLKKGMLRTEFEKTLRENKDLFDCEGRRSTMVDISPKDYVESSGYNLY